MKNRVSKLILITALITCPLMAAAKFEMRSSPRVKDNCFVGQITSVSIRHQTVGSTPVTVRISREQDYRDVIFVGDNSTGALGLSAAIGKTAQACLDPASLQVY